MPIRHGIWKVGESPQPLPEITLDQESLLEKMIVQDPRILSDRWMMIGQQVPTSHGGVVDLLALNPEGHLIVVELKRDQTPREVVSQGLDYDSWAQELSSERIAEIFQRFSDGGSLSAAFHEHFGQPLDEEQLNGSHQVVIVASSLDPVTERIVNYLNGLEVPINVIFFQVFQDGDDRYLSRAWLIDPVETETKASSVHSGSKVPWNQEYYVSFGHDPGRRLWEEWGGPIRLDSDGAYGTLTHMLSLYLY